jgi:Na+/proline symporter
MAVASVFAYDIYKVYFKPSANGEDIMRISRYVVVVFGLCMGVLGVVLFELKLNLGWVYLFIAASGISFRSNPNGNGHGILGRSSKTPSVCFFMREMPTGMPKE